MKKYLLILGLLGLMASCDTANLLDLNSGITIEGAVKGLTNSSTPVTLYKETQRSYYIYHGISGLTRTYSILVADLAYDKKVNIRFQMTDGTWKDFPASYVKDLADNQELWQLELSGNPTYYTSNFSEFAGPFAVNYTVAGKTYWDNNQGQNYFDRGTYLHPSQKVSRGALSAYGGLNGEILVRNLAPSKKVSVVYTRDNWATTEVSSGSFNQVIPGSDLETWGFWIPVYGEPKPITYAISYDVNGTTFWDNNFGQNYTYP